ncbi:MAG: V-type ATP synthase subunit B [bacterium]|nr:V-type ATP synthase subunit B [bacterium]
MQTIPKTYTGLSRLAGPIILIENVHGIAYGEVVEIIAPDGSTRQGRVLDVATSFAIVQSFEGTYGLAAETSRVRFMGRPFLARVSEDMLGRVFDGLGNPRDGGPPTFGGHKRDVNGAPINPVARRYPREFIQTGISAIDGMNTLIRGQKLPIFSGNGLPHNQLAAQIVRQAKIVDAQGNPSPDRFSVIFAAMGVKYDVAQFFRREFEESGALANVTMFLNLASDPPEERIITPRLALTLAEFLAFERGYHVLVVLTDMTNYCEALREIAMARGEVPSRKGYPGYMYSDLASLYERTGRIHEGQGSITQLPILTMPNDDITHPVPDLTGYITEGQIVLSRELAAKGIYPPINVLPSLSRIMKDGIGKGYTRADHPNWATQLYAAYSRVEYVRSLAAIIGEDELTDTDKAYLRFGEGFEQRFVNQGTHEDRSIRETLARGWELLAILPEHELTRVSRDEIAQYLPRRAAAA